MEGNQVFLLVLFIIIGVYVFLFLFDLVFVLTFTRTFYKHNKALQVFLSNKYDNITKMISLLQSYDVAINVDLIKDFNEINKTIFINQESEECRKARLTLSMLRDELVYLADKNEEIASLDDVKLLKENIIELDGNYRTLIAMYNADVLGYNYWISFLPTRYIYKLFKLKKKEIIN